MTGLKSLITIIFCHLVGDYPLQQDFIAQTKGLMRYHMLVHCALYCVPFAVVYGIDVKLLLLFVSHLLVDSCKGRYKAIGYVCDQVLHYMVAIILYLLMV